MLLIEDSIERRLVDALYYYPDRAEPEQVVSTLCGYGAMLRGLLGTAALISVQSLREMCLEVAIVIERFLRESELDPDIVTAAEEEAEALRTSAGTRSGDYTSWVHFAHAEQWSTWLAPLVGKPGIAVLEVGSYEGRSACWLLNQVLTGEDTTLVCVDAFFDPETERRFDANTQGQGGSSALKKLKGLSSDILPTLSPQAFDVVYLDATSEQLDVLTDCTLGWRLVRPGGLLIMDDYGGPEGWEPGVTAAVDAFLEAAIGDLEIVSLDGFQAVVRRKDRLGDA